MTKTVDRRKIVIALGLAVGALCLALFVRGTGPQPPRRQATERPR